MKSPRLEAAVSHVVVGRLAAFHKWVGVPDVYLAEVEISEVEKGDGVITGSRIFVRFTSSRTIERIHNERVVESCGDRKIDPLPGEWLRVYANQNENFQLIADYPQCFFGIGRSNPNPTSELWRKLPLSIALVLTGLGLLTGYVGGSWAARRKQDVKAASKDFSNPT